MSNTASFEGFLKVWEPRQKELLDELSSAGKEGKAMEEGEMRDLITRALSLFEEYYEEKSRAAHRDAFQMFSSNWCSPLESAFFWLSGFRPSVLIRLVSTAVDDLSPDQLLILDRMKRETRSEEKALSDEQARIQETMAAPPVIGPIQRIGWQQNNIQNGGMQHNNRVDLEPFMIRDGRLQPDKAMEIIQAGLEDLVVNADNLRTATAAGIVAILNIKQSMSFLEAAILLQRKLKYVLEENGKLG